MKRSRARCSPRGSHEKSPPQARRGGLQYRAELGDGALLAQWLSRHESIDRLGFCGGDAAAFGTIVDGVVTITGAINDGVVCVAGGAVVVVAGAAAEGVAELSLVAGCGEGVPALDNA